MDYETNIGLSRLKIRRIAEITRKEFEITTLCFPVLRMLDMLEIRFPGHIYHVVEEDDSFESSCMAYLSEDRFDEYCIHIRESVYEGAVQGRGNCLGFICHEIAHFILLFLCEVRPKRDYANRPVIYARKSSPWCSTEWQAMALCGELMIPYETCKEMELDEIMRSTKSSEAQARYFLEKVVPHVKT